MTNSNLTEVTLVIDISVWMQDFLQTLNATFANRVLFVGLQGSYGRGAQLSGGQLPPGADRP